MSFFTQLFSASNTSKGTVEIGGDSNVLGVTGLSRRSLAAMIRQDGLFGRDSGLAPVEQAIVQSQLGPIAGLRSRAVLTPIDGRLAALETFTDAVVRAGGRVSASDQAQLVAQGFSADAVSEVVNVVRLARDVFGLVPQARAGDARLHTLVSPRVARAA